MPIVLGTTSACAENTPLGPVNSVCPGNYLRVRGEYPARPRKQRLPWELPPRARRIRYTTQGVRFEYGTTSACAENTAVWLQNRHKKWNYLRVRGEYGQSTGI